MKPWKLPTKADAVCVVIPPTRWFDSKLFLYAHDVYVRSLHTLRLVRWLEGTCRSVTLVDNLTDPQARLTTDGPRAAIAPDVRSGHFGLSDTDLEARLGAAGDLSQIWITTLFPYDKDEIARTIALAKATCPGAQVVVGGAFATILPKLTARMGADAVHEGLLDEAESVSSVRSGTAGMVCVSRGCPNRCSFCANHRVENRRWMRGGDDLLRDIDALIEDGASLLDLYSVNFFAPDRAAQAEELFEHLAERDVRTLLWTGLEPRRLTPKRAEIMRRAGCIDVLVPLQTVEPELTARWGRGENLARYGDAVSMLEDAGFDPLELASDMLIGHPDQSLEGTVRTACHIWSKGLSPLMFPYTFVPGTRDFQTYGHLIEGLEMSEWFPYIFPFARDDKHRRELRELAILSRVSPPFLGRALEYLDPDSRVKALVEDGLDAAGFDVPQHPIDAPLPPLRSGYQTFLSHPWEAALYLSLHNHADQAAALAPLCERVRVCAPKYLEIPRRLLMRGFDEEARTFAHHAAWSLPRDLRRRFQALLKGDSSVHFAFETVGADVSRVLEGDGLAPFAARWRALAPA